MISTAIRATDQMMKRSSGAKRISSRIRVMMPAPMIGPINVPRPPTRDMITTISEVIQAKVVGCSRRKKWANMLPVSPATPAPMLKARTL